MAHFKNDTKSKNVKTLITILILGLCNYSFADEQRYRTEFANIDSTFILKFDGKKSWVLRDNQGEFVTKIKNENFTSMTIKISSDGNTIAVIDDFVEGHKIKERYSLWIFHKGKLTKKYKLRELLDDTCNVAYSVWHIDWLVSDLKLNSTETELSFLTNEFYEYQFDVQSGNLIKKQRPANFDENTLIVYGTFRQSKGKETNLKIHRYIAGNLQPENQIKFKTDNFGDGLWTTALMIKDGIDITPNEFRYKVMINSCLIE